MALYDIDGNVITTNADVSDRVSFVKSVSHRGTTNNGKIVGYTAAKAAGFEYGENDINFTSDGYVIMRHDSYIDYSGTRYEIADLTYAELIAMESDIPTLQEWLECMKCIALHPYIDTKRWSGTWSLANLQIAIDIVIEYGFSDKCTWLIGTINEAETILASIPNARIGWLVLPTEANMTSLLSKVTDDNDLFFDSDYAQLTSEHVQRCIDNSIPLEVYTITSAEVFETAYAISDYISGFTCNGTIVPSSILMAKYIS